ncbi:MAG: alpha/beta hydrolase [Gammaproteobacteria bacterium]
MKKFLKYSAIVLVLIVLLGAGGIYYWATANVARPGEAAILAMRSDGRVTVTDGKFVVFRPADSEPTTGLILYPGATCDVRGYAPVLRRIADRGYLVIGVQMPLNMAIFAPDRADEVRAAFPDIKHWVIAGHSMGGAMAGRYAHNHPDDLAGAILWDAYPPASDTLVDVHYPVWLIHRATADGQPPKKFSANRDLFPVNSRWLPLRGGIHMQFGSFVGGGYTEEWTATITPEAQHDLIVTDTLNALLTMAPPVLSAMGTVPAAAVPTRVLPRSRHAAVET